MVAFITVLLPADTSHQYLEKNVVCFDLKKDVRKSTDPRQVRYPDW